MTETCRTCRLEKKNTEFPPRAGLGLRYLSRSCRDCVRASRRAACKRFRETHPAYHRQYGGPRAGNENGTGGHFVGEKFEGRTLASYKGRNVYGHHLWLWICDACGTEYGPSTISHLKRPQRCRKCAFDRDNNARWLGYEQISGIYLWQCRDSARKRGYEWLVTPEDLWAKWLEQDGRCAYTGWILEHSINASLDRIDSNGGYTIENIQWVHKDVNRMKSNYAENYFITVCMAVAARSTGPTSCNTAVPTLIADFSRRAI